MGTWTAFLFAYVLGGLTFIPLVILAVLYHAHRTSPYRNDADGTSGSNDIVQPGDDTSSIAEAKKSAIKAENGNSKSRQAAENEVAAGFFAVCREYTPMGINAKPIERATPVGSATVAAPSQSVYQTMYKSIFDRKQAQGPLDNKGAQNQRPKNAGNVFYAVLRHGHILLFDDEEQLEVRHVISLAHHDVSIYSGGDVTPEGELWIKRNAICLTRRGDGPESGPDSQVSKPFYLFSEDSSAKEDFYFAMLRNQAQYFEMGEDVPKAKQFEVKNIITLVQKLHSTEDHMQTRWFNAMVGRIFLGLYQTADLEHLIREKLTKKMSRVPTPSFLTDIAIRKIETGESAPVLLNPKHKDLTVDGECSMEADVKYNGNFRIEVSATVRIDLGSRFKAREVTLVLAVVLKKLEGHVFFKIKPPPSNRVWLSFQTMPKMEMTIEPIVSSRQITYTVILRQIENRIKEVFAETLVQPFWDDMPFFNTEHKKWRGGIWEGDDAVPGGSLEDKFAQGGDVDAVEQLEESGDPTKDMRPLDKSYSAPILESASPTGLFSRKIPSTLSKDSTTTISTGVDPKPPQTSSSATSLPKAFKSQALPGSSDPVVGTDATNAGVFKPSSPPDHASSRMAALSARNSPALTPIDSPVRPASVAKDARQESTEARRSSGEEDDAVKDDPAPELEPAPRRGTASSTESANQDDPRDSAPSSPSIKSSIRSNTGSLRSTTGSITRNLFNRREDGDGSHGHDAHHSDFSQKRTNTLAAVANAATQARQWGWNAIQKRRESASNSGEPDSPVDLNKPMGRGRPLPPPGTPLPRPDKNAKVTTIPALPPKRKSVSLSSPPLPDRVPSTESATSNSQGSQPPPLPARRRRGESQQSQDDAAPGSMLVVEMPLDSGPTTPLGYDPQADLEPNYMQPWVEDKEDFGTDDGQASQKVQQDNQQAMKPPPLPHRLQKKGSFESRRPKQSQEDEDDDYSGWLEDEAVADEAPSQTTVQPADIISDPLKRRAVKMD